MTTNRFQKMDQPQGMRNGLPLVLCFYDKSSNQLTFWCNFCQDWHRHGNVPGPRVSHCVTKNHILSERYYIDYYTSAEEQDLAFFREHIGAVRNSKSERRIDRVVSELRAKHGLEPETK